MSRTEIWTDRLLLRAAQKSDLPAYHKWFTDPGTMTFWSTPPFTTLEQTEEYLDRMIAGVAFNGITEFTICLPGASDSGATVTAHGAQETSESADPGDGGEADYLPIGKAGLWDGRELGYLIDPDHRRKGYAFEALDAILKHVWALETPPEVVVADVDPENIASLQLLQKLGFMQAGTAKNTYETHLGWRDSVYMEARRPKGVTA